MRQLLLISAIVSLVLADCHLVEAATGPGTVAIQNRVRGASSFIPPEPGAWTNEWYIATDGNDSNSGTNINEPKTIAWAWGPTLNTEVDPGDTVWFRGGWYEGGATGRFPRWTNFISGTASDPVTFRAWPGERPTLHVLTNGSTIFRNYGKWSRLWGFEFTCTNHIGYNPDPNEPANGNNVRPGGYSDTGFSNTLINCVFNRVGNAIGVNSSIAGTNLVTYGSVFVYNGWQYRPNASEQWIGTGYPFYWRNDLPLKGGPLVIEDCMLGGNFSYNIHGYGAGNNYNGDCQVIGSMLWNFGTASSNHQQTVTDWMCHVDKPTSNWVSGANVMYTKISGAQGSGWKINTDNVSDIFGPNSFITATNNLIIGYSRAMSLFMFRTNGTVTNNTFVCPANAVFWGGMNLAANVHPGITWDRNTYYNDGVSDLSFTFAPLASAGTHEQKTFAQWQADTGFDANSTRIDIPSSYTNAILRQNRFEPDRANLYIINANTSSGGIVHTNYDVDVSSVYANGTVLKVRNAVNFWEPHATVTVTSGKITVPMTNMVAQTPTSLDPFGNSYTHALETTNGSVMAAVLTTW